MTRRAVIENNIVTNIIEADPDFELPGKTLVDAGNVGIGWTWDGETFAPPPEPDPQADPVPYVISRRQIMTGLALAGWITEQEALDAIAIGARPAAVEAVISALPEDQQFHARMKWAGFTEAHRTDPLVLALADAEGKSEAEIDDFFRMCAAIE